MPRFVILFHECPAAYERAPHWDLMFERGEVLLTWAILDEPAPGEPIAADALADHRLAYLDYEGPVSGDRGKVTRWDAGTYEVESENDGRLEVVVNGSRLSGRLTLTQRDAARWDVTFPR